VVLLTHPRHTSFCGLHWNWHSAAVAVVELQPLWHVALQSRQSVVTSTGHPLITAHWLA
jgi:hypothetical protein